MAKAAVGVAVGTERVDHGSDRRAVQKYRQPVAFQQSGVGEDEPLGGVDVDWHASSLRSRGGALEANRQHTADRPLGAAILCAVGAVSDTQHAEEEESVPGAQAARDHGRENGTSSPVLGRLGGPARVLALQRAVGNAAVARLISESQGTKPSTTPASTREREMARLSTASQRVVQRGFFGSLWSGIKSAASSAWSGIKGAASAVAGAVESVASSIWDGAKRLGNWAADWLKSAGGAVWEALKWFGAGAWDVIKVIGTVAWEKLSLLGTLAWDFISFLPARLWRLVIDGWDAISGLLGWLYKGLTGGVSWAWAWDGFKRGLLWCGQTFLDLLQVVGVGEGLQFIWGLIFHTRLLTDAERAASESVHGPGLIPYWEVRVDQDSFMIKLGVWLSDLFGTKTKPLAITTMHIIQAPVNFDLDVAVHELTHVAQYQKIGAIYMPQALHAQGSQMGYNYGDLTAARANGQLFSDFNREQQASICQDYYRVKNGQAPEHSATEAQLEPFVQDMRSGAF
jgi:hypothetical protein